MSNKYHAKRTEVDGIVFDSKREAKRYSELKLLERAGEIADLKLQTPWSLMCCGEQLKIRSARYPNGRKCVYVSDFDYLTPNGRVIEDSKGVRTDVYKLKRAIMEANGYRILET